MTLNDRIEALINQIDQVIGPPETETHEDRCKRLEQHAKRHAILHPSVTTKN